MGVADRSSSLICIQAHIPSGVSVSQKSTLTSSRAGATAKTLWGHSNTTTNDKAASGKFTMEKRTF